MTVANSISISLSLTHTRTQCVCTSGRVCVCVNSKDHCCYSWFQCAHAKGQEMRRKNTDGEQNHEQCAVRKRSGEGFVWCCWWWSSRRWRGGGGGGGGINTVMESEWEGARGGRSREMIPLSNPLDTRSVWLPTGSERERRRQVEGAGREREKPSREEKNKMKGREERRAASRKPRWQKRREREGGREDKEDWRNQRLLHGFRAEGRRRRRRRAMLQSSAA